MSARVAAWAAVLGLAPACAPDVELRTSMLEVPTVLAVIAAPPEQRPGRGVRYTAIVGGPDGPMTDATLAWSFCTSPRPLGEEGPVHPACLAVDDATAARTALPATGLVVTASLTADACRRFGPDPPPGDFRAQDPDATGGYYQTVLLRGLEPDVVFGHRLRCGLARAGADVARAFEARYADNVAPEVASLVLDGETLRLALAPGARETYVVVEPGTDAPVERTETLTLTWWTSRGSVADARRTLVSDRAEAPWSGVEAGATAWAVVRDERGASAVASIVVP